MTLRREKTISPQLNTKRTISKDNEINEEELQNSNPSQDPTFFNFFVENKYAEMLARQNLDKETKLEVTYRILKDTLKRTQ